MPLKHQVTQESALIIYDALVHAESDQLFPETELQTKLSKIRSHLESVLMEWDSAQCSVSVNVAE